MTRLLLMLAVLMSLVVLGCSSQGAKERKKTAAYEQVSPFETGQDPFEVK